MSHKSNPCQWKGFLSCPLLTHRASWKQLNALVAVRITSPESNGAKTMCVVEHQLLYQPLLYQRLKAMSCGFIVHAQSQRDWVYLTSRRARWGGAAVCFPLLHTLGTWCAVVPPPQGTCAWGTTWPPPPPQQRQTNYANQFPPGCCLCRGSSTAAVLLHWGECPGSSSRCFSNKCRKLNKAINILPYGLRKCSDMNAKQLNLI